MISDDKMGAAQQLYGLSFSLPPATNMHRHRLLSYVMLSYVLCPPSLSMLVLTLTKYSYLGSAHSLFNGEVGQVSFSLALFDNKSVSTPNHFSNLSKKINKTK